MGSKMTFEEAQKLLHNTPWKTVPCGSKGCWCLMILPVNPILYGDNEEIYVSGAGELSKDIAEYIVSLHNERLERENVVSTV